MTPPQNFFPYRQYSSTGHVAPVWRNNSFWERLKNSVPNQTGNRIISRNRLLSFSYSKIHPPLSNHCWLCNTCWTNYRDTQESRTRKMEQAPEKLYWQPYIKFKNGCNFRPFWQHRSDQAPCWCTGYRFTVPWTNIGPVSKMSSPVPVAYLLWNWTTTLLNENDSKFFR